MIDVFFNAVLPVFAVVAVGFAFGRGGLFDFSAALALNRFVFYAALPLLLFRLIATSSRQALLVQCPLFWLSSTASPSRQSHARS